MHDLILPGLIRQESDRGIDGIYIRGREQLEAQGKAQRITSEEVSKGMGTEGSMNGGSLDEDDKTSSGGVGITNGAPEWTS